MSLEPLSEYSPEPPFTPDLPKVVTSGMSLFAPASDKKEEQEKEHSIVFDYATWGLAEKHELSGQTQIKTMLPLTPKQVAQAASVAGACADLKGFKVENASEVQHYCGEKKDAAQLALVRFEREDDRNHGLHGEHVSITVDLDRKQVMGLTRMQPYLNNAHFVNHQTALNKAVIFLKAMAPDLMPEYVVTPELKGQAQSSKADAKMDFENNPIKLGDIEVHWIGGHKEEMVADGTKTEIHGMKVKMYIPKSELWTWVIVDKQGNVETFERDICWNFREFRRETQLWLHDKWLDAQNLTLPSVIVPQASQAIVPPVEMSMP